MQYIYFSRVDSARPVATVVVVVLRPSASDIVEGLGDGSQHTSTDSMEGLSKEPEGVEF